MSVPGGAPGYRRWTPTAYQAAVALSGSGAVLGLGRELLIVHRLGLGSANDALQLALSVTYTISLLGEPLRLAALNLLDRRIGPRMSAVIGWSIALAALLLTALYASRRGTVPLIWVAAMGSAGAANLVLAWVLPRRQRAGPFLPVHTVTVLPSILMPVALLFPAGSDHAFAARVVGLFLLAPLVQLIALAALSRHGDTPPLAPPLSTGEGLRPIGWHAIGAGGGQATQFFLRTALAAGPAGTLTAFSLVLRASDTIRAVFVDTYIASRIRRWAAGERASSAVLDGRWLGPVPLAGTGLLGLVISLVWAGRPGTLLTPVTAVLGLGTYLGLALRVRYQAVNTSAQPLHLVRRVAALELAAATTVGVLAQIPGVAAAVLPWTAYVAKPALGLRLLGPEPEGAPPPEPED